MQFQKMTQTKTIFFAWYIYRYSEVFINRPYKQQNISGTHNRSK